MRHVVRFTILCAAVLIVSAHPATAQESQEQSTSETIVTLTMRGAVQTAMDDSLPRLPVDLMERLGEQSSLAELEVSSSSPSLARMQARFVFEGLAAFRQWYETESTRRLMRDIDGAGPSALETAVRVRRHPQVRYAEEGDS